MPIADQNRNNSVGSAERGYENQLRQDMNSQRGAPPSSTQDNSRLRQRRMNERRGAPASSRPDRFSEKVSEFLDSGGIGFGPEFNGSGVRNSNSGASGGQTPQQDQKEQEWMQKLRIASNLAHTAGSGARLFGQDNVADVLDELGDIAEGGEDAAGDSRAGTARKTGSNSIGGGVGWMARRKGLGGNKAAALGGGIAGALKGEGIGGIASNAFTWTALRVAIRALFTLVGSIPALLYLNFHYVMSKFKPKIFGEMFFWQKIVLLAADILVLVVVMIIIGSIVAILDPCLMAKFIGTWWSDLFGGLCALAGK